MKKEALKSNRLGASFFLGITFDVFLRNQLCYLNDI